MFISEPHWSALPPSMEGDFRVPDGCSCLLSWRGGMNVTPLRSDQDRKGRSLVPKKSRSGVVQECYRRAAEARRMADRATNRPAKADFLAIEQRWLSLARSYEAETVRAAPRRAPRSEHKLRGRG
jgi:hypothetical protein